MVVGPTFFIRLNYSKEPMSKITKRKDLGLIFRSGMVLTSIFLIIFMVYNVGVFQFENLPLGSLFFILGAISLGVAGIVSMEMSLKTHIFFVKGYFTLTVLGLLLFGISLLDKSFNLGLISVLISTAYIVGVVYLYFKDRYKAYSEYWCIILATLWVLSFYFF